MGNGTEAEPEQEPGNREDVLGRDQERVHYKEAIHEMKKQHNLLIHKDSNSSVAMEDLPLPNAALTIAAEEVISAYSKFVNQPQAQSNGGDVGE
jgi:hypothetical protein